MLFAESFGQPAKIRLGRLNLGERPPKGRSVWNFAAGFSEDSNRAGTRKQSRQAGHATNYWFEARSDSLRGALFCKTLTR